VAERVDALDLGSCGEQPWGFESPLSHHKNIKHLSITNVPTDCATLFFAIDHPVQGVWVRIDPYQLQHGL
jgi:hypothetical protein